MNSILQGNILLFSLKVNLFEDSTGLRDIEFQNSNLNSPKKMHRNIVNVSDVYLKT